MCTSVWDSPVQGVKDVGPEDSGLELGLSVTWSESLPLLGCLLLYLWCEEVGLDSPMALLSPIMFPDPTWTL